MDVAAWTGLALVEQIREGNRNEVWRGTLEGRSVSVRRSRRSPESLDWELDLITELDAAGIRVPVVVPTQDGRRHVGGIVVQQWLEGRAPSTEADWRAVADTLHHLHTLHPDGVGADLFQRPGCMVVTALGRSDRSVDADMAALPDDVAELVLQVFQSVSDAPVSVIHGDTGPSNIRIGPDGVVGLLDFDESRVDVCWHDLSELGVQILDDETHARAQRLSHAWEAANAWVVEPDYARSRLERLLQTP